jgi:endonuclease YncB( thermonuclease family)
MKNIFRLKAKAFIFAFAFCSCGNNADADSVKYRADVTAVVDGDTVKIEFRGNRLLSKPGWFLKKSCKTLRILPF